MPESSHPLSSVALPAPDPSEPDQPVYAANTMQAILLAIPVVGATLERLIAGPGQEFRQRRFEATLNEVVERLRALDAQEGIFKEQFIALLERTAPGIATSTVEDKRKAFRSLLINAALTPARSIEWEEAQLASDLLQEIEWPGIELLSKLHAARSELSDIAIVFDDPSYLAFWPNDEGRPRSRLPLSFPYAVTETWVDRLTQQKLITFTRPLRRPLDSADGEVWPGFGDLKFTRLGELLVKWVLVEKDVEDR
jgi:hypothetical protein